VNVAARPSTTPSGRRRPPVAPAESTAGSTGSTHGLSAVPAPATNAKSVSRTISPPRASTWIDCTPERGLADHHRDRIDAGGSPGTIAPSDPYIHSKKVKVLANDEDPNGDRTRPPSSSAQGI
jgi:hypothetical protein